jgi:hypothetical protein
MNTPPRPTEGTTHPAPAIISKKMLRERAVETARNNGRQPHEVTKTDWERAKRELSGGPADAPGNQTREAFPTAGGWPALPYAPSV